MPARPVPDSQRANMPNPPKETACESSPHPLVWHTSENSEETNRRADRKNMSQYFRLAAPEHPRWFPVLFCPFPDRPKPAPLRKTVSENSVHTAAPAFQCRQYAADKLCLPVKSEAVCSSCQCLLINIIKGSGCVFPRKHCCSPQALFLQSFPQCRI